jgi:hypothetical protein
MIYWTKAPRKPHSSYGSQRADGSASFIFYISFDFDTKAEWHGKSVAIVGILKTSTSGCQDSLRIASE